MISPILATIITLEVIWTIVIVICILFFEDKFVAFEDKIIFKIRKKLKGGTKH